MDSLLPFEKEERKILIKKESDTSKKFGIIPDERSTKSLLDYGIINIDKPKGPTSHQVSAYVQQILKIDKSGHSGTLDPKVTGILPVAIGRSTRIVQLLLTAGKEYVVIAHMHKEIPEPEIREAVQSFVGRIRQLPPIKSSVKRDWRDRKVYYFDILELDGQDMLFRVGCQAGTYIRKLIHDLGVKLGCGAHMAELRRTKAGPFNEDSKCTLQELSDAYYYFKEEDNDRYLRRLIRPVEFAVSHLPKIWVFDATVDSLCHGASLKVPGISKLHEGIGPKDIVAIMTLKDELVAYGYAQMKSDDIIKKQRGIAASVKKVFMLPKTYPKMDNKDTS